MTTSASTSTVVRRRDAAQLARLYALMVTLHDSGGTATATSIVTPEGDISVPDPYTGGPADFERAWRMVDAAAVAITTRCKAIADGHGGD